MSLEEVIEILKIAKAEVEWEYPLDYAMALDIAIKHLKALDTVNIKEENNE